MKKSWQQRLAGQESFPKVLRLEERLSCCQTVRLMGAEEGHPVVLVSASEIWPIMAGVPEGNLPAMNRIFARNRPVRVSRM